MSTLRVEEDWTEIAKEFLRECGFKKITRMPRYSIYDFMCEKDGKTCFVEMKTRSAKAQTQLFVVSEKKLKRLRELQENTNCPVYLLFINKFGKWLLNLDEFLQKLKTSPYPLIMDKLSVATSGKVVKAYFQQAERIIKRGLANKNAEKIEGELKIIIRCKSYSTKKKFRQFILDNDFKNSEEALLFLLRKAEELQLKPERGYAVL
jgi:hypothetical protein